MIHVLLVDNSRFVGDSISRVLDQENNVHIVGCATTVDEVQFLLPHCNVALVSTSLGQAKTLEFVSQIHQSRPNIKIIVSGVDDEVDNILNYVEAGAAGYILQDESAKDLVRKIQLTYDDKAVVSPHVAARMIYRLAQLSNRKDAHMISDTALSTLRDLTPREREVLDLVSQGYTNQEIADALVIQCGTVKNHVHNILKKLDLSNRNEAASVYAMQAHAHQRLSLNERSAWAATANAI